VNSQKSIFKKNNKISHNYQFIFFLNFLGSMSSNSKSGSFQKKCHHSVSSATKPFFSITVFNNALLSKIPADKFLKFWCALSVKLSKPVPISNSLPVVRSIMVRSTAIPRLCPLPFLDQLHIVRLLSTPTFFQ